MDLVGVGVNAREWVDSAKDRDYCRALVNATFELLGSISQKYRIKLRHIPAFPLT